MLEGTAELAAEVERGAYVLIEGGEDPDVVLIGTGSEVSVCVDAASLLAADGITARVVSMPSWDLFDEQDDDYQDAVLGAGAPVLSVEAASSFGWARWADDSWPSTTSGPPPPAPRSSPSSASPAEHVAERARTLYEESLDESSDIDLNDTGHADDQEDPS